MDVSFFKTKYFFGSHLQGEKKQDLLFQESDFSDLVSQDSDLLKKSDSVIQNSEIVKKSDSVSYENLNFKKPNQLQSQESCIPQQDLNSNIFCDEFIQTEQSLNSNPVKFAKDSNLKDNG